MRQICYRFRFTVNRAVSDDAARAVVHIEDGSEAEINPRGPQFGCQDIPHLPCEMARLARMLIQILPSSRIGGKRVNSVRKRWTLPPS